MGEGAADDRLESFVDARVVRQVEERGCEGD